MMELPFLFTENTRTAYWKQTHGTLLPKKESTPKD